MKAISLRDLADIPLVFPREGDVVPILLLLAVGAWLASKLRVHCHTVDAYRRFFAVATLFGYGTLDLVVHQPVWWDHILGSVLRAFLMAGVVHVAVGILMPCLEVIYRLSLGAVIMGLRSWWSRLRYRCRSWKQRAEDARKAREAQLERERLDREAHVRRAEEEARRHSSRDEQTRRENARAELDLFVATHAEQLPASFGPAFVAEFTKKYLADVQTPEIVESQVARLIATMTAVMGDAPNRKRGQTVDELTAQFEARKREIEALPISPEMKQHLQFKLRKQLAENIEKLGGL